MTTSPDMIKDFVIAAHFDLPKVKALLEENPELLRVQHQWGEGDFEDGLAAAAHVGNEEIAEFFLAQGVPLTICAAAMLGRLPAVQDFLLQDPALANARGAHGISLMFHAALSGDIMLTTLLREYGCREGFNHALHGAVSKNNAAMVAWLLDNGVTDPNTKDHRGKTPLQTALEGGQVVIAELLQNRGAQAE